MPCYYTGSAEGDAELARSEMSTELTKVAQMLCALCENLENVRMDHLITGDTVEWWKEHKEIDQARAKREEKKAKKKALRKQALSKLTSEERAVLERSPFSGGD